MKIGSLFSGIGGLDLACETVFDGRTVWQVEGIDLDVACFAETHPVSRKAWAKLKSYVRHGDFNRRVLARHWPDARQLCDVRTVGAHDLEPVDVICGGFPCQDLSVAGTQAGLDGERSGLYREMHRIVGELLPRYVVIENVPGLLKYRARLSRDFAALGYGLRWQPIAAQDVGAPHRRRRVFVLACRDWRGSVVLETPRAGERVAAWPTPTAKIGQSGPSKLHRPGHGGGALHDVVHAAWPTPLAGSNRKSRRAMLRSVGNSRRAGGGHSSTPGLEQAVEMVEGRLPPELQGVSKADVPPATRAMWPTPIASDSRSAGNSASALAAGWTGTLTDAVRPDRAGHWPTPTASNPNDGEALPSWDARNARSARYTSPLSEPLGVAVRPPASAPWPTPTTQDGSNNGAPSQDKRNTPPLNAAAGGALNPAWVELLMGLPSGWSAAEGNAMTWPGDHAWPAGRGQAQRGHEPLRLVESRSVPSRNLRLRSLGNGVVPHQAIEALTRCLRGPRQPDLFT